MERNNLFADKRNLITVAVPFAALEVQQLKDLPNKECKCLLACYCELFVVFLLCSSAGQSHAKNSLPGFGGHRICICLQLSLN